MATLAESLVSSSSRKLRVRRRADLEARQQRYLGTTYWIVKDPVGLNYFRFQEEEYFILQLLDGSVSLDEIKQRFEDEFPPQKITLEELQQFLGQLHQSGLIVTGAPGQGHELLKRRRERRRRELLAAASNILCIRFKGVDPERFLNWLYPKVRWMFSRWFFAGCAVLWIAALALILVEFDAFRAKLPGFYQFFSPTNALLLAATLAVTKVLHELGHALSCKHFQGECHEIGVMILVLTPCLYCNVSDSWMLPNKWHRAAIGAAGIFVELTLAAAATFFWWFTEVGLLHYLCLNIMFICSVSTVLFNGNPLLRYDGYYVLADVMEIPNMRQKASLVLNRKLAQWFLGLDPPDDPFLPQRRQLFFSLYTIAAVFYRWFILFSILMFLYKVFEPYGLKIVGQAIAAAAIYGLLFQPIYAVCKFFYVPGRWHQVKKIRMYASIAGLLTLVGLFVFLPLPYHVMATLEIQPRDADTVYVPPEGGKLEEVPEHVQPGRPVAKGTVLARLRNLDLDLQVARLQGERQRTATTLANVEQWLRYTQPGGNAQIDQLREVLKTLDQQLAEKQRDRQQLELRAPSDGVVFPPPWRSREKPLRGQLAGWSGIALLPQNRGAFLEGGTPFCLIGNPRQMKAMLVIDQADFQFVAPGQPVEIKLDQLPFDTFEGTIEHIAEQAMEASPVRLAAKAGGELPTKTDRAGIERPMSTSFQASVYLDDPEQVLRVGLRGHAKIHVAPQTLGQRLWRWAIHTFNFKL